MQIKVAMYVFLLLKYLFLFFSVCILPVRVFSQFKKTDISADQIFLLGLLSFFGALIFVPVEILNILVVITWGCYFFLMVRDRLFIREISPLLWTGLVAGPLILIFYQTTGHFYDLHSDTLNLNQDILWHIGISSAFKIYGFYSTMDPHILNTEVYYHALAHSLWAKMSLWTGDGLFESVLAGSRPAGIFFSCWVVFSFFAQELKNKYLALISTFGVFFISSAFAPWHVFSDPFINILPVHLLTQVTGEELVYGVFFSGLIAIYRLHNGAGKLSLLMLGVSVLLCLGIKAPYGVCLVGTLYILSLWEIFVCGKMPKYLWQSLLVATVSFVFVYMFHYGRKDSVGMVIEFAQIVKNVLIFQNILDEHETIGRIMVVVPYVLGFFGPMLLILLAYQKRASNKSDQPQDSAIVLGTAVFFSGLAPFLFLAHVGYSQLYFAFSSQLGLGFFSWMFLAKNFKSSKLLRVFFVLLTLFSAAYMVSAFFESRSQMSGIPKGDFNQACLWIRNNTDKKSLIATNKHYILGTYPRFFNCSAIAERQFLVEGYEYNDRRLETAVRIQKLLEENRSLFMEGVLRNQNLRVDYLVYFKDLYGERSKIEEAYRKVFEDDYAIVYMRKID